MNSLDEWSIDFNYFFFSRKIIASVHIWVSLFRGFFYECSVLLMMMGTFCAFVDWCKCQPHLCSDLEDTKFYFELLTILPASLLPTYNIPHNRSTHQPTLHRNGLKNINSRTKTFFFFSFFQSCWFWCSVYPCRYPISCHCSST